MSKSNIKVALCFYGQPRFLDNPLAPESHKQFIIDKYKTDVFCHFWHDPEQGFFEKSDFSKAPRGRKEKYQTVIDKNAPGKIQKLYSPKVFICEKPKRFIDLPSSLPDVFANYQAFDEVNFSNLKSQLYSWQKVLELFSQHDDGSYDYVVVSRFDNHITAFPNLQEIPKGQNHSHATYDIAVFTPNICSKIKPFDNFDKFSKELKAFDAAGWKRLAVINAGSHCHETHRWKFDLIRQDKEYTILIPMAGGGTRFKNEKYSLPKPLIDVNGKPMIRAVLDSINFIGKYVFIVREFDNDEHNERLRKVLKEFDDNCEIVTIKEMTAGAAETCLKAKDSINTDNPLIVTNCDQIFKNGIVRFVQYAESENADGLVAAFKSSDPKYSYIKVNSSGEGIELKEKEPISDLALTGLHYWKRGADFVRSAEKMIADNIRHNNEFYIAPSYNNLINDGLRVLPYKVEENDTHIVGTPEELEKYLTSGENIDGN